MTVSFPFALVLIPYGLILLFFVVFAVVNIAHLVGHGATTMVSFLVTWLFLTGAAGVLFTTHVQLADFDWSQPAEIHLAAPTAITPAP